MQHYHDPLLNATSLDADIGDGETPFLESFSVADIRQDSSPYNDFNEQFITVMLQNIKDSNIKRTFLLFIEGYSKKEISKMLKVTDRTIRKYLAYIRSLISEVLKELL